MSPKLGVYDRQDLRELAKLLRPVVERHGNPRKGVQACFACIVALESAARAKPDEWVYWSSLGDYLLQAQFQDEALAATAHAYWLRPADPRSTYALASAFYQLSRARVLANMTLEEQQARYEYIIENYGNVIDPFASRRGLEKLGMSVQDAAAGALHFFSATLRLVKGRDAEAVRRSVTLLLGEFPAIGAQPAPEYLKAALAYVDGLRPQAAAPIQREPEPKPKRRWPWS